MTSDLTPMTRPVSNSSLASLFLRHGAGAAWARVDRSSLARVLGEAIAAGRAAWPDLSLAPESFVVFLAERALSDRDPVEALASLAVADLYLACACACGDAVAMRLFDRVFLPRVAGYVAKVQRSAAFADEVGQRLRSRLLFSEASAPPKIASYKGTAPLAVWLRTAAVRTARNLVESQRRDTRLDSRRRRTLADPAPDPEVDLIKRQYAAEFRAALQETIAGLPIREQNVLRLYFLDDTPLRAIGAMYRVHESTVARWIARCRESIAAETRRRLRERLRLGPSELASVMAQLESRLDLSISRILGRAPR
jgi:RNA polymerase sigma-70 factor (ECF subfamily)